MWITESVVEVGGSEEPAGFEVAEGVLRVGEELLVEGPARPSVLHVPVHVQHKHVQRQPARFVVVDDLQYIPVVEIKPAGPPEAEGLLGDHGDRPAHLDVVLERAFVVVAVKKTIPVLGKAAGGQRSRSRSRSRRASTAG